MSSEINFPKIWVCDGREPKPKNGASSSNTWICDGKEIKPKNGASSSNTWVVEGRKIKPKNGANSSNTYDTGDHSILAVAGKLALRLY